MRYRSRGPIRIGEQSFCRAIKKKYGMIVLNAYEPEMHIPGTNFTLTFEAGPRDFPSSRKGWTTAVTMENMVWLHNSDWSHTTPILVGGNSLQNYSSYYMNSAYEYCLGKWTWHHPEYSAMKIQSKGISAHGIKSGGPSPGEYDNVITDIFWTRSKTIRPHVLAKFNELDKQKDEALKQLAKDNKWNKTQLNQYIKEENKKIRESIVDKKLVNHMSKELDLVAHLSLALSSLIEEAKSMQDYLADCDNRLNVSHYKSRIKKVRDSIKTINKMRTDSSQK